MRPLLLTYLLLFLPAVVLAAAPVQLVIDDNQVWQGEVHLDRSVVVASGAELSIAPGTRVMVNAVDVGIRVEGALQAIGTEEAPILFSGPTNWIGIELLKSSQPSRFVSVRFSGAKTAIGSSQSLFSVENSRFDSCGTAIKLHRQSKPSILSSVFVDNSVAIDIEMRSQAVVRDNEFLRNEIAVMASHNSSGEFSGNRFFNNDQGMRIKHHFPGRLQDNEFANNQQALVCDQTMDSPQVLGNRFTANQQGVVSLLASKPLVRNNRFENNQQALVNNQLGSPAVERNLFYANEVAIQSERRSAPRIRLNSFRDNRVALFCDYLSYPLVKKNNFHDNLLAVKLGEHQSSDMDKQGVSQKTAEQFMTSSGRQGKMAVFTPASGVVDISENWWGDEFDAETSKTIFYDRHREKWVKDDVSGEHYLRDLVNYSPWLKTPVTKAGLEN